MTAHAVLSTDTDGVGGPTRVDTLRSQAPLILRSTGPHGPEPLIRRDPRAARVSLASGAAGPIGGDDFTLEVRLAAGSTLLLSQVSASLLLPGVRGGVSQTRIRIRVGDDATLVWLPEPLIAANRCNHRQRIEIALGARARLLLRDELVLGRYGEQPGRLSQQLRVTGPDGRSLFQQRLDLGPGVRGWSSPAVAGRHKCIGTVLALDLGPTRTTRPDTYLLDDYAAVLPLAGPGAMISALADDTVHLRRVLDRGIGELGPLWSAEPANIDQETRGRALARSVGGASSKETPR